MRRFAPILILVIGLLALAIDFWPGLKLPTLGDPSAGAKVLETKLGLDLQGGTSIVLAPVKGADLSMANLESPIDDQFRFLKPGARVVDLGLVGHAEHQHHVARLHRHVSPRSDRNTDVRRHQCWGVVYAITHHTHLLTLFL